MKVASIISAVVLVVGVLPTAASATTNVTICHSTGSGWVQQSVSQSSVEGGNGDHNTSGHQGGKDIVPPGAWDADGHNWNAIGQAIWNNNCETVSLTGTSSCVAPNGTYSITWTLTNLRSDLQMDITSKDFDGDDNLTNDSSGDSFDDDNGSIDANFSSDPVSAGGTATAVTNHDSTSGSPTIQRVRLEVDVRWQSNSGDSLPFGGDQDGVTTIVNHGSPCPVNTAPVVTITGANPMDIIAGGTYSELGATWTDTQDGNGNATPSGSVNTSVVGSYNITYSYTDAGGLSDSEIRTVNVIADTDNDDDNVLNVNDDCPEVPGNLANGCSPENTAPLCSDTIDNDGDDQTDLSDSDCAQFVPPTDVCLNLPENQATVPTGYELGENGQCIDIDEDNDGVSDEDDNCPAITNADQGDTDGDDVGDECDDFDNSNDDICEEFGGEWNGSACVDLEDNIICAAFVLLDLPLPESCNDAPVDTDEDNDGIEDDVDNCPLVQNPLQENTYGTEAGDACETPEGDNGDCVENCDDGCEVDCGEENQNPAETVNTSGGHVNTICDNNEDDDNDGLYDENDPGCENGEDGSEENPVGGIGNAEVAGAACGPVLNSYLGLRGKENDPEAVKIVQEFLNKELDLTLEVNGEYNEETIEAVKAFQTKYSTDVLGPWGISDSTGIVYLTTQRMINMISCPGLDLPMPELN